MGTASVFVLADDLSGAAETAAVLMSPARRARIALSGPPYAFTTPVLAADLDCRYRDEAGELVRQALRHAGGRRVLVKIDSLLRGNLAAMAAATLHAATPRAATDGEAAVRDTSAALPTRASHPPAPALVVFAPALPAAGRVTVGGVPYLGGLSLRETRAWQVEPRPAPASITEALGGVPSALVPLEAVRAGRDTLARALSQTAGRIAVCDAETDSDLDEIVSAAMAADHRTRFVGAGGLASALGRFLDTTPACSGFPDVPARGTSNRPLLVVVGTAEPGAAEQARLLLSYGARPITLDAARDLHTTPAHRAHFAQRLREALRTSAALAVLTISGQAPPTAAATLAELVGAALTGHTPAPDLVLTGGETARRVLDTLQVRELTPVGQIHHGAVHCHTPQGRSVVTRPGSFGDRDSLLRIAAHLAPERLT
ncbi:4-hydroxythreonine-4-phosphate dehydrogenase [Nonomuraea thailandensis]|uniref:4-hydroxythreonine-4-phosphate dehydrogenase n=1 Tax=Nonomuraea thailandensis TaxID=1188745 RepID=A0A9X2GNS6_9ACTN|nr:four-carbon acid sugar kinase family protein [Nonomuraea thailandensis]MCP2358981.1 4-hydroxythreonine-4-phosphate dehydrogenase [Nonomuraea thailandensis]